MRNKFMTIRMTDTELKTIYELCDDVNNELFENGCDRISRSKILRTLFSFLVENKKWIVGNYYKQAK